MSIPVLLFFLWLIPTDTYGTAVHNNVEQRKSKKSFEKMCQHVVCCIEISETNLSRNRL